MKFGVRKPSIKRSIKARTTGRAKRAVKRAVNPVYGKKGVGLVTNPKRALRNQVYRRTTVGVRDIARPSSRASTPVRQPGSQSCAVHLLLLFTTFGVGNIIYALMKSSEQKQAVEQQVPTSYTIREGKSVPTDAAFAAWTSGDVQSMRQALDLPTNLVDRHFLLLRLAEETYRLRSDPAMAQECARVSEMHLQEFERIAPALRRDMGVLPRVPTFQNYATLLTEQGDFNRAVWVCELALHYGLEDGTKSGFKGRIERIRKKQAQAHA